MNSPRYECSQCGGSACELNCLPCSHTVCTHCFHMQNSHATAASVNCTCPIDKHEFHLADDGIESFPTRGFSVEVSNNRAFNAQSQPAHVEMDALLTYTQEYKNDLSISIRDMEHAIHSSLSEQEVRVKEEIRRTAEDLIEVVLAKEKELYRDVDRFIEAEKREKQQQLADFSLEAHHIVEEVRRHHGQFKQVRDNPALMDQLQTSLQTVNERKSALMEENRRSSVKLSFKINERCFEEPIGKVECRRSKGPTGSDQLNSPLTIPVRHLSSRRRSSSERKRKAGQVIKNIVPPSPLTEKFRPWAVSVSESGHIAVVDRGNNCIHIFNPRGDFLRHVAKPYGNQSKFLEVYGVTFLSRSTFAVAEYSPSTGSGCLLEMDISGEHLRVIGNLKGPAYITAFNTASREGKKIIAVYYTNSLEAPEIFGDESKLELPLQENDNGFLFHPQKGVFLKDKLVFSDINERKNQGCVKVFESQGQFSHEFGKQPIWNEEGLGHPLRIAADPLSCKVLVYHQFSSKMMVYDVNGVCVSEFRTVSGLLDFVVTADGHMFATCSNNSEFPNSLIVLSYNT